MQPLPLQIRVTRLNSTELLRSQRKQFLRVKLKKVVEAGVTEGALIDLRETAPIAEELGRIFSRLRAR